MLEPANVRELTVKLADFRDSMIEDLLKKHVSADKLDLLLKTQAAIQMLHNLKL